MNNSSNLKQIDSKTQNKLKKVDNMIKIYKLRRDHLLSKEPNYCRKKKRYAKVQNTSDSTEESINEGVKQKEEPKNPFLVVDSSDAEEDFPYTELPPRPVTPFARCDCYMEIAALSDRIEDMSKEIQRMSETIDNNTKAIAEVNDKLDYLYSTLANKGNERYNNALDYIHNHAERDLIVAQEEIKRQSKEIDDLMAKLNETAEKTKQDINNIKVNLTRKDTPKPNENEIAKCFGANSSWDTIPRLTQSFGASDWKCSNTGNSWGSNVPTVEWKPLSLDPHRYEWTFSKLYSTPSNWQPNKPISFDQQPLIQTPTQTEEPAPETNSAQEEWNQWNNDDFLRW